MKTYSVLIKAFAVLVVDAEDKESAMEIATDEVRMGDFQMEEAQIEKQLKTAQEIAQAKRFADRIVE